MCTEYLYICVWVLTPRAASNDKMKQKTVVVVVVSFRVHKINTHTPRRVQVVASEKYGLAAGDIPCASVPVDVFPGKGVDLLHKIRLDELPASPSSIIIIIISITIIIVIIGEGGAIEADITENAHSLHTNQWWYVLYE